MADANLHMNLEQVRETIQLNDELAPTRKRDLTSAINTLSKWLQLPLANIPADRRDIRKAFEGLDLSQKSGHGLQQNTQY